MAIPAGTRFGPYEIIAPIGAGGMGEVHRARDTRLGRDVAIKTLPAGLAADSERLRRFEIEAKAASLLSHPNILSIYDIGTANGQPYIVSELLEGENLRERLSRGALAPRKVVEIGVAVAEALAAAHARGIVHRDLKPENLFLLHDGRPKILDFGIAKLTSPDGEKPGAAATVTMLTDIGVAVGTLGYMSPEQVRGEPVDHRSDIFALGAILHEMLTGAPAFRRDSRIATVNAVLEAEPPELPDDVAPALRRIIQRAVEKHPDERFQSARDLAFALSALSGTVSAATTTSARRATTTGVGWRVTAAIAVLSAAVAGAVVWSLRPQPPPDTRALKRFSFEPPAPVAVSGIAISPDGTRLVYSAGTGADTRLYQRRLDELESKPMEGTEGGYVSFFSPDGNWVAFPSQQKLKKVPVNGGPAVTICDVRDMLEGSWGADGTIVLAFREQGLKAVSAQGGTPRPLTEPDTGTGEIDHHAPFSLAGGALLFTIHAGPETFRVAVRSPNGDQRVLIDEAYSARYVSSGHILYGRPDGLYAAPFDLGSLQLAGPPVLVVEQVLSDTVSGTIEFGVAEDGTLAYIPAQVLGGRQLTWVNRSGKAELLPIPPHAYNYPTLSPDGKRVAIQISDGPRHDIWLYEFSTDSLTRLTLDGNNTKPVWSSDGRRVTYAARRTDGRHIMWQPLDATAPAASLVTSRNTIWPGAWTPSGDRLVYVEDPPTSLDSLKVLRVGTAAAPELLLGAPPAYHHPHLSPDGQWLAYVAFERGRPQVFIRPLAGGATRQITSDGGRQPRWSRDGRELFFRRLGAMMRMDVRTTPALQLGRVEKLFDEDHVSGLFGPPNYDITADGQRFLMVKRAEAERSRVPIHVVVNWLEELKQRVPSTR